MPRYTRPLVAGFVGIALCLPAAPVTADQSATELVPAPAALEAAGIADIPVPARDVTDSDANLASTRNEVTVLTEDGSGAPAVTKLRTGTPAQAAELAAYLDAQPGAVAAPTARMVATGAATRAAAALTTNPEPMAPEQWNLPMVGAPAAWRTTRGAGVVVAVVDTGVDATQPDLVDQVLPEVDLLPAVTPDVVDTGHGTTVASLIAARIDGQGMAGVAPEATILPVAALDPAGFGDSATVARGIIAAADAGARVINLSLGGPVRDPVLDRAAVYAHKKGAILVAAAGNSFQFGNEVQYPAASPYVVAVAAVDRRGNPAAFSNTGSHIDIAGPGVDVLAAAPEEGFGLASGTSFAAPHVSGTLALVLSANPRLTASAAISLVQLTAKDDARGNGRDNQLGQGLVRADRAVAAVTRVAVAALPTNAKLRLRRFNASPEPLRRGRVSTASVTVESRYPDGSWRVSPAPAQVRFEFRATGTSAYRTVGLAAAASGSAVLRSTPTRSGVWRARIKLANGSWVTSDGDYLQVRR